MLRISIATAALLLASGAMAQELTAAQREACTGDFGKYCKGTVPGGGRIIACLAKHNDQLTPACQKVLAEAQKK
jgi:Cysteine rich repeat